MGPTLLQLVQYGGIRGLAALAQALPFGAAVGLAHRLADLTYLLDGRHRRVAEENLRRAFGDQLEEDRIRSIVREVYRGLFTGAIELLFMRRLLAGDGLRRCVSIHNLEPLERLAAEGRGIVFVTGHYGNWEIMGAAVSRHYVRLTSVARPLRNDYIDRYVRSIRESFGQRIVAKKGALKRLTRAAQDGEAIGFVIDQNVRRPSFFVDFFGRPASASTSFALLARRLGLPVMTAFCRRVGSFRFEIFLGDPIEPDPDLPPGVDARRIVKECTRRLEACIREAPEQWMWLHRRWRTRPKGEEPDASSGATGTEVALA